MTAICPHCGYDLSADAVVERGRFRWDPRNGIYVDGALLHLAPQARELVGAIFRADGRIVPYAVVVARLAWEGENVAGWVGGLCFKIQRAFARIGLQSPIKRIWGTGMRWVDPGEVAAL